MAADKGNVQAMFNFALMLSKGDRISVDKVEAAKYFKMAADKGDIQGMYHYASMLNSGDGIPVDKNESLKYYKRTSDLGDEESAHIYDKIQNNESNFTKNVSKKEKDNQLKDEGNNQSKSCILI